MRKLKQLSLAAALMLALSTGAMAGIVTTPPAPEPPPPEPPSASVTATGIVETPPQSESAPTDPTVSLALTLLQTVLSVF